MAVTATSVAQSPNRITFVINQDNAAGATLTITNAVLQAACVPGPLKTLLAQATTTTAIAQANVLGIGTNRVGVPGTVLGTPGIVATGNRARVITTLLSGAGAPVGNISVDAAASANLATVTVACPTGGGAVNALLTIELQVTDVS